MVRSTDGLTRTVSPSRSFRRVSDDVAPLIHADHHVDRATGHGPPQIRRHELKYRCSCAPRDLYDPRIRLAAKIIGETVERAKLKPIAIVNKDTTAPSMARATRFPARC